MSKPTQVIPEKCRGYVVSEEKVTYGPREVMLYALGIGISQDPLDEKDLKWTYENSEDFAPIPSFAVVLSSMENLFGALLACPGLPEFNPMMLLHGEEKVVIHKPLPASGNLTQRTVIQDVVDKNSGALLIISIDSFDAATKEPVCSTIHSLFIRGIGGFGGGKGAAPSDNRPPKNASPTASFEKQTTPNQALVYRLSGDYNPLHADKQMAEMGGFDRPILHGLCFFGIGTHAVVRTILNNDVSLIRSIEGRFSSPVLPGHKLKVEMWRISKEKIVFQVINEDTKKVCLSNGGITLAPHAAL
eukprot:GDKJ01019308.1.p1 GENE.GDKJ01019308.1~~GDKJ01019308.1.p1  ORF type:complete len:302 (-),score=74.12 GDKJ01019308.1:185-1090(-)